jgi:uncharacterized membrane protein (UPF0127 family)
LKPARVAFALALFAMLGACEAAPGSNAAQSAPAPRTAPSGLDLVQLTIRSGARSHLFQVEVARTPEQQERGLMDRQSLAADFGMLFPFYPPRPASFWMHDTPLALDLIFIRPDGSIARIITGVPMSETPMVVDEPLTAVLEIQGGRAAALGISAGDRVSWTD